MDKTLISVLAGLGAMFGWGTSDFFANLSSDQIGHLKAFFGLREILRWFFLEKRSLFAT